MELFPEHLRLTGIIAEPDYEPDEVRTAKQAGVCAYSADHTLKSSPGTGDQRAPRVPCGSTGSAAYPDLVGFTWLITAWVTTSRVIWTLGHEGGALRLKDLTAAEVEGGGVFGFGIMNTPKITFTTTGGKMQLAFKDGGREGFLEQVQAAWKCVDSLTLTIGTALTLRAGRLKKWEVYVAPVKSYGVTKGGIGGLAKRAEQEQQETQRTLARSAEQDRVFAMVKAKYDVVEEDSDDVDSGGGQ